MAQAPLDPNDILQAEFEYIAQTATQANEDRAKVASFYFVTVGSLMAAILGTQFLSQEDESLKGVFLGFSALFAFLTMLGYFTLLQLARLRTAWIDSARSMNRIKEYYIERSEGDLAAAFRWRENTLPKAFKKGSVANYLAAEVALLSGLIFGAAAYFFQQGAGYTDCLWAFTVSLGVFMGLLQFYLYKRVLLQEDRKNE
jgi:hypothetical protein